MMTHEYALNLAGQILNRGRNLVPARFPRPSREVVEAWAGILAHYGSTYPSQVWPAAVDRYAAKTVNDTQVTPRDILDSAREVIAQWEGDPEKRAALDGTRAAIRAARVETGSLPPASLVETPAGAIGAGVPAPERTLDFIDRVAERRAIPAGADADDPTAKARARVARERNEERRAARRNRGSAA
ncbi:hypothetical protein [Corynebacterium nuruki]|uniref:hypothetical protein n=1 Tax=Corynebacterium nuruki TaxID=1032851 RepID=UPI0039BFBF81